MKYHQTIVTLGCALLAITLAEARTITVDNKVGFVAMFNSVQAACDFADPGDTILIAGSPTSYGSLTLTKRLNLVGPGYFLNENSIPGITKDSAVISISFQVIQLSSPTNSSLTGLVHPNGMGVPSGVTVSVDRCYLGGMTGMLGVASIKRSYLGQLHLSTAGSSIQNSVIGAAQNSMGNGTTATNCIIHSPASFTSVEGSSVSSSVFITPSTSTLSAASFAVNVKGSVTHCLAVGGVGIGGTPSYLPSGNGNNPNIAFTVQAFVEGQANDKAFILAAGSPAIGTGLNGVDMGIFGGVLPYVISGVPSIPRITRFQVPATATSASGLRIEMDAQSF